MAVTITSIYRVDTPSPNRNKSTFCIEYLDDNRPRNYPLVMFTLAVDELNAYQQIIKIRGAE